MPLCASRKKWRAFTEGKFFRQKKISLPLENFFAGKIIASPTCGLYSGAMNRARAFS
jgi:hypothetical protein